MDWTRDRIDLLSTPEVRQLRVNAERLRKVQVVALCDEVLGKRPARGARRPSRKAEPAAGVVKGRN